MPIVFLLNPNPTTYKEFIRITDIFFILYRPAASVFKKMITKIDSNTYQVDLGDLGSQNFRFQFDVDSNYTLLIGYQPEYHTHILKAGL